MKLAIIGSGPLAIFCAHHFDQLGAEVILFQKNALGGNVRFLLEHFPEMQINFQNQTKSLKSFWDENLTQAISELEEKHLTRAGEVLRVHKRFLHPHENISNKTRLHDLFRVIFSVNPKDAILKQLEENPEMFKVFKSHGITPHIVDFRHYKFWDGGLHCITNDLDRGGTQKDYFPERVNN